MAKIDLKKIKECDDDIHRKVWLNLDTSLYGSTGTGKTTWALNQAAYVASLFDEDVTVYILDTEGAYELNLMDEKVLNPLLEAGVDIDLINLAALTHVEQSRIEGLKKLYDEIARVRKEVLKANKPAIFIIDSLSDLRNQLQVAFTNDRKDEENIIESLSNGGVAQIQDWGKVKSAILDIIELTKNNNIHSIFTSRERAGTNLLEGYANIEYDCDAHIRLFKKEANDFELLEPEDVTDERKAKIEKCRGPFGDINLKIIEGDFEAFKEIINAKLQR